MLDDGLSGWLIDTEALSHLHCFSTLPQWHLRAVREAQPRLELLVAEEAGVVLVLLRRVLLRDLHRVHVRQRVEVALGVPAEWKYTLLKYP